LRKLDEKYLKSLEERYGKMNEEERREFAKGIIHQLFSLDMKYNRR
jgi:hypothetical protein